MRPMMPESQMPNVTPHPLGWVPNVLTTTRILSIPIIMWGILSVTSNATHIFARSSTILALFLLAGFTDFLDGFLARRWNVASDFGRMIDPIADKLLVAGCLVAICIVSKGTWLILVPAMAIIFRDVLVSGAREHAALSSRVMPPTKLAKWKTACEMLAIFILMFWVASAAWLPIYSAIPPLVEISGRIGSGLLWLAAILSLYTGMLYFRAALAKAA